jgi:hypothetical protein
MEETEERFDVQVSALKHEGKTIINISLPENQATTNRKHLTYLLTGGISLLIKSCKLEEDGIKDHELLRAVITQLEKDFISTTSYDDVEMNPNIVG